MRNIHITRAKYIYIVYTIKLTSGRRLKCIANFNISETTRWGDISLVQVFDILIVVRFAIFLLRFLQHESESTDRILCESHNSCLFPWHRKQRRFLFNVRRKFARLRYRIIVHLFIFGATTNICKHMCRNVDAQFMDHRTKYQQV